jgi:hypothetical protein
VHVVGGMVGADGLALALNASGCGRAIVRVWSGTLSAGARKQTPGPGGGQNTW